MPVTRTSGQGRPKGVPNKTTADIKALAQSYGPAAIANLAKLAGFMVDADGKPMPGAESEQARIAATKELLDRGFGKAVQPQSGPDGESNPVIEVVYKWQAAPE